MPTTPKTQISKVLQFLQSFLHFTNLFLCFIVIWCFVFVAGLLCYSTFYRTHFTSTSLNVLTKATKLFIGEVAFKTGDVKVYTKNPNEPQITVFIKNMDLSGFSLKSAEVSLDISSLFKLKINGYISVDRLQINPKPKRPKVKTPQKLSYDTPFTYLRLLNFVPIEIFDISVSNISLDAYKTYTASLNIVKKTNSDQGQKIYANLLFSSKNSSNSAIVNCTSEAFDIVCIARLEGNNFFSEALNAKSLQAYGKVRLLDGILHSLNYDITANEVLIKRGQFLNSDLAVKSIYSYGASDVDKGVINLFSDIELGNNEKTKVNIKSTVNTEDKKATLSILTKKLGYYDIIRLWREDFLTSTYSFLSSSVQGGMIDFGSINMMFDFSNNFAIDKTMIDLNVSDVLMVNKDNFLSLKNGIANIKITDSSLLADIKSADLFNLQNNKVSGSVKKSTAELNFNTFLLSLNANYDGPLSPPISLISDLGAIDEQLLQTFAKIKFISKIKLDGDVDFKSAVLFSASVEVPSGIEGPFASILQSFIKVDKTFNSSKVGFLVSSDGIKAFKSDRFAKISKDLLNSKVSLSGYFSNEDVITADTKTTHSSVKDKSGSENFVQTTTKLENVKLNIQNRYGLEIPLLQISEFSDKKTLDALKIQNVVLPNIEVSTFNISSFSGGSLTLKSDKFNLSEIYDPLIFFIKLPSSGKRFATPKLSEVNIKMKNVTLLNDVYLDLFTLESNLLYKDGGKFDVESFKLNSDLATVLYSKYSKFTEGGTSGLNFFVNIPDLSILSKAFGSTDISKGSVIIRGVKNGNVMSSAINLKNLSIVSEKKERAFPLSVANISYNYIDKTLNCANFKISNAYHTILAKGWVNLESYQLKFDAFYSPSAIYNSTKVPIIGVLPKIISLYRDSGPVSVHYTITGTVFKPDFSFGSASFLLFRLGKGDVSKVSRANNTSGISDSSNSLKN